MRDEKRNSEMGGSGMRESEMRDEPQDWSWDMPPRTPGPLGVRVGGVELRRGDRVRLCPRGGADIFDLALAGKTATITAIEQDYEDRVHLAVTIDDDPGNDLGRDGKPGHRFFFSPDEVEPLAPRPRSVQDENRGRT